VSIAPSVGREISFRINLNCNHSAEWRAQSSTIPGTTIKKAVARQHWKVNAWMMSVIACYRQLFTARQLRIVARNDSATRHSALTKYRYRSGIGDRRAHF
jgi:hypothetical protein